MNFEEAKKALLQTGGITLLTRTMRFDGNGDKVSDTITDRVRDATYPTPIAREDRECRK